MKIENIKEEIVNKGIDLKYFEMDEVEAKVNNLMKKVKIVKEFADAQKYHPIYYPNEGYDNDET